MSASRTFFAATLTVLFALGASAVPTATSTAQQRYEQDRAACAAAKPGADRSTCMKEASAALAATRSGELDKVKPSPDNALERCKPLPEAERKECEARMRSGTVSGSVEGGGVLRELVTTVPAASSSSR
ncbi:MAG: hypothetical protein ABI633_07990 [Burkholderiales bacterium]